MRAIHLPHQNNHTYPVRTITLTLSEQSLTPSEQSHKQAEKDYASKFTLGKHQHDFIAAGITTDNPEYYLQFTLPNYALYSVDQYSDTQHNVSLFRFSVLKCDGRMVEYEDWMWVIFLIGHMQAQLRWLKTKTRGRRPYLGCSEAPGKMETAAMRTISDCSFHRPP